MLVCIDALLINLLLVDIVIIANDAKNNEKHEECSELVTIRETSHGSYN